MVSVTLPSDESDFGKLSDEDLIVSEAKGKAKSSKRGRKSSSTSESNDERRRRKASKSAASKYGAQFVDSDSSDGASKKRVKTSKVRNSRDDFDDTDQEKEYHLSGKWRQSRGKKVDQDQDVMPAYRVELEERWNPLIKLMGVELRVESGTSRGVKKIKADGTSDSAYHHFDSEESNSDVEDVKPKRRSSSPLQQPIASTSKLEEPKTVHSDGEPVTEDEEDNAEQPQGEEEEDEEQRLVRIRREGEARRRAYAEEMARKRFAASTHIQDEDMNDDGSWPRKPSGERPKFDMTFEQSRIGPLVVGNYTVPAPINRFLRPYQREGVEFLLTQYKNGIGGILGDDMGLGKTIQVIAFLSALMKRTGRKEDDRDRRRNQPMEIDGEILPASHYTPTCLIVCPASVMYNWYREIETWGWFAIETFSGDSRTRRSILNQFKNGLTDILICSFEAARSHIDLLEGLDISVVIVDEAHRLKNPAGMTTQALHRFPTKFRYGLTGTAIQNDLHEFWTILDWSCPGHLGTQWQWQYIVADPLKYAQSIDAPDWMLAKGRERAVKLVGKVLPKYFLRRTKQIIRDQLPKKQDNIVLCPLTPFQLAAYKRMLDLPDLHALRTAHLPCPCGNETEDGYRYIRKDCRGLVDGIMVTGHMMPRHWTKLIFKYMAALLKAANHLALLAPDNRHKLKDPERYERDVDWAQKALLLRAEDIKDGYESLTKADWCGKWDVLKTLLEQWKDAGQKVLIFSNSLRVLEIIRKFIEFATNFDTSVVHLDGSVAKEDRMKLVDEFNNNPDVFCFCSSTKAGGVGLNLTAASKVVIFDPQWNPALDLQAMDRAYRIGQTQDVEVYRLIGAGTIEELVYHRQQYKRALASIGYDANAERRVYSGVQKDKNHQGELFGMQNLFKLQEHHTLSEMVMQRYEELEALDSEGEEEDELDADEDLDGAEGTTKGKKKAKKGAKQARITELGEDDDVKHEDEEEDEDVQALRKRIERDAARVAEEQMKAHMTEAERKIFELRELERNKIKDMLSRTAAGQFVSDEMLGETERELRRARKALEMQQKHGLADTKVHKPPAKEVPKTAFAQRHAERKAQEEAALRAKAARLEGKQPGDVKPVISTSSSTHSQPYDRNALLKKVKKPKKRAAPEHVTQFYGAPNEAKPKKTDAMDVDAARAGAGPSKVDHDLPPHPRIRIKEEPQ